MNRKLKRLGIWIALLAILSGAGLFLSRGVLLRHVADKRIAAWSARYDIGITYASLRMPSLSAVRVEGLSVVPARRDTLLRLASAEVKIDFFSLLRGDIRFGCRGFAWVCRPDRPCVGFVVSLASRRRRDAPYGADRRARFAPHPFLYAGACVG